MCCKYNNIINAACVVIAFVVILVVIIVISNSGNNEQMPNILVAVARPGDNTTLGTTSIRFSQNEIVEGTAISHQPGSDEINTTIRSTRCNRNI